jgi:hypothetical protein
MKITRLEDIDKRKSEEKRDRITDDINHVMEGVLGGKKKKQSSWFWTVGKIALVGILLMVIVNLILGNIWLLKFFWGEMF